MGLFGPRQHITELPAGKCHMCGWDAPKLFDVKLELKFEIFGFKMSGTRDIMCEPCMGKKIPEVIEKHAQMIKSIKALGFKKAMKCYKCGLEFSTDSPVRFTCMRGDIHTWICSGCRGRTEG